MFYLWKKWSKNIYSHNITEHIIFQESKDISSYALQHDDFYESTEISETTRKPLFIDNIPQEIPYLVPNPSEEIALSEQPPVISVPIIAFLDPAKMSNDKIDVPIAAELSRQDGILKNQLENERDEIQRNVQNYIYDNSWRPNNWRFNSSSSEVN